MKTLNRMILGLASLVLVTGFAAAQEKGAVAEKKPNVQDTDKKAKPSAAAKAVQDLELANQLIRYGRAEKNAEALLLAAQILHKTPSKDFKTEYAVTSKDGEKVMKKAVKEDNSPKALVAEAKKLSTAKQVEALAMATQKLLDEGERSPTLGPMSDTFTIGPMQIINWNPVQFKANERAEVYVSTGILSVMTLEVIDENGNVVVRDSVPGNYYRCTWTPRWTGNFRIRLISDDTLSFNCKMYVN